MRSSVKALLLVLVVTCCVVLAGCTASAPARDPEITGVITSHERFDDNDALAAVLVEGTGDYDRAYVSIMSTTTMLREATDGFASATIEDLSEGTWVKVWLTGPVAESYPVQATAEAIVIAE